MTEPIADGGNAVQVSGHNASFLGRSTAAPCPGGRVFQWRHAPCRGVSGACKRNPRGKRRNARSPADQGFGPILRVHDRGYVGFLQSAHAEWLAAGRAVTPSLIHFHGRRSPAKAVEWYSTRRLAIIVSTPRHRSEQATWDAAYWSAQTALSAVDAVLSGDATSFGICRPPGHHAGSDYCGGYCYLNNAAIAAERAIEAGRKRVAILDVDYHHGNGTQDIFAGHEDVFFASIHADPRRIIRSTGVMPTKVRQRPQCAASTRRPSGLVMRQRC